MLYSSKQLKYSILYRLCITEHGTYLVYAFALPRTFSNPLTSHEKENHLDATTCWVFRPQIDVIYDETLDKVH